MVKAFHLYYFDVGILFRRHILRAISECRCQGYHNRIDSRRCELISLQIEKIDEAASILNEAVLASRK